MVGAGTTGDAAVGGATVGLGATVGAGGNVGAKVGFRKSANALGVLHANKVSVKIVIATKKFL